MGKSTKTYEERIQEKDLRIEKLAQELKRYEAQKQQLGNRQLLLLPTALAKSSWTTAQVLSMTLPKSVVWYLQRLHFRHMLRRNMLTMRGIKPDGTWAQKEKKIYALDEDGNRIPLIDSATGE